MPDGYITDRQHLATVIQDGLATLLELQDAWLAEDSAACFPTTGTGGPRSSDAPDPTGTTAGRDRRYTDRDRIGRKLLAHVGALKTVAAETRPRHANGPCRCCKVETATHGVNDDGNPALCHPCHRYLQHHGYRCTDDVHQDRPRIRWCDCPPSCCDPCPDHAAEGRTLSDRCRQRKARGLWSTTDRA